MSKSYLYSCVVETALLQVVSVSTEDGHLGNKDGEQTITKQRKMSCKGQRLCVGRLEHRCTERTS